VTGYTLAEAIGQNPSLLKSGLVDQALYEAMWRTVLSGQVWRGEFHNRKKDGELFWANAVVAPIRDDQGTITNYIAITEDTTERKKAEDALRANEARFRSVFENTPIGLSEQDLSGVKARFDGFREQGITELRAHLEAHPRDLWELAAQVRILQANGTCLGLFGAPTQAGFAEAYPRIFGEGCLPVFLDEMAGLYGGSLVLESGIRRCRLEGKDLDLQVTLSVVPGHEGDLARVLMAFVDQTEKVASEEENLRLDRELSHLQRLESLGRLSSGVAHDMNNVLMVIMAVGDRLKLREDADASLVQSAEYLLQTAARGRDLVKGLRDFSRKELETTRLLDLNDLVATEAELLRHTTLSRIRIDLDLAEGLPSMLGDANGIANAIMNLAVNAFDAMPLGGRIGLSTRDLGDGFIELAVTDDGEGMPPEVQARALEPFYTTKPAGKGTGLGLSQVFGTMKAHGGAMSLTSVPGEGTRVALTFPVPRETRPGAPADAGLPRVPRRNLEIMLVDDEALVLRTCTLLLQDLGHGVQPAGSGLECLRLLKAGNPFDLVVLDVNMPGMDGIETMSRIRLLRPDLPVLFCSGHFDDRIPAILARFPEVRMLEKPFDVAAFDQVLVDWF